MGEEIVDVVGEGLKEEGGEELGGWKRKRMGIWGGDVGGCKKFE